MTVNPVTASPLTAQVVHETIDGETVVIDLATGSYYSLEGSAAVGWEGLIAGDDVTVTAAQIASHYGGDASSVRLALFVLHSELHSAGLLRVAPIRPAETTGEPFLMPPVRRYDDMREHLLVDPIHEVERGEGWPTPSA